MPKSNWLKAIRIATKCPAALVGNTKCSLLQLAVTSALRTVYEKRVLGDVVQCILNSSSFEYRLEVVGGKLDSGLLDLFEPSESCNVMQCIWELM